MFETIDHVGIAVLDLERAAGQYEAAFGMPLVHRETVESQGVDAALLDVGPAHVELLQPLGPETVIGRFISKRGEGLHHVAYRVAEIDATLAALKQAGIELIDTEARVGIRGSRVAFLHPKAARGVLTELVEPPGPPRRLIATRRRIRWPRT
ncbi:MAG: methylmalonyl-CoA epimerase [Solirubrobacterales bacterium]